jgi:hypothetical protein
VTHRQEPAESQESIREVGTALEAARSTVLTKLVWVTEDAAQTGSAGGFPSPGHHNTLYAAPHRAFHHDYRAVAG